MHMSRRDMNILVIGFVGVFVIGLIVINIGGGETEKKLTESMLLTSGRLSGQAIMACGTESSKHGGDQLSTPISTTVIANEKTLKMKWVGDGSSFKNLSCTYDTEDGVTSLIVDGEQKVTGSGSATKEDEASVEEQETSAADGAESDETTDEPIDAGDDNAVGETEAEVSEESNESGEEKTAAESN